MTGVKRPQHQRTNGSGTKSHRSGIDSMMISGTTGVHPRMDSPPTAGPGIRATGIMTDTSSNMTTALGTDSKARSGLSMVTKSQLSQKDQEVHRSADHSSS